MTEYKVTVHGVPFKEWQRQSIAPQAKAHQRSTQGARQTAAADPQTRLAIVRERLKALRVTASGWTDRAALKAEIDEIIRLIG